MTIHENHINNQSKPHACGIVVEYNPFHAGHAHHIQEAKSKSNCDVLIAVMSPQFVQRGDLAVASVAERAKCAIAHGVDLVVELPYPYCLEHADKFAEGAVKVLHQLQIESLCFGSESNNITELQRLANEVANKHHGKSLAASNASTHSNDILGVAYLRAIKDTAITPITIQRTNSYKSTHIEADNFVSATAIRAAYQNNKDISFLTPLHQAIETQQLTTLSSYYPTLRYLLLTRKSHDLKDIFLMDEGIEGLFQKQAQHHENFDDFLNACTSKRYIKANLMRTLCHLLLQTTKAEAASLEQLTFVRILAMNGRGIQYLRWLKEEEITKKEAMKMEASMESTLHDTIPIISNFRSLPKEYQAISIKMARLSCFFHEKTKQETLIKEELQLPYIHTKKGKE